MKTYSEKYDDWRNLSDEEFDTFFESLNFTNDSKNLVIDRLIAFHESGIVSEQLFNDLTNDHDGVLKVKYPNYFPENK